MVDAGAHMVTASISHFTCFGIIGREAPAFNIADLSVSPSTVNPGESVSISAQVTNSGGMAASYTLTLLVDGAEEATQELTLGPGESDAASFGVTRDIAGTTLWR